MQKFIYTGPSWAELSYELLINFTIWPNYTNLALEWNLNCYNVAKRANSNYNCIDSVKALNKDTPVVWLLCEPLIHIYYQTTYKIKDYLTAKDHLSYRQEELQQQLVAMNDLGLPIGIIGSHSDIRQSDIAGFKNLSIIHPSWQNFLANEAGIQPNEYNWGYDVAHLMLFKNKNIQPSDQLIMDTYDGLEFWHELQNKKVFFDVHPNKLGTIKFAKHIKQQVVDFINQPRPNQSSHV
jgi:hypothetical protein